MWWGDSVVPWLPMARFDHLITESRSRRLYRRIWNHLPRGLFRKKLGGVESGAVSLGTSEPKKSIPEFHMT